MSASAFSFFFVTQDGVSASAFSFFVVTQDGVSAAFALASFLASLSRIHGNFSLGSATAAVLPALDESALGLAHDGCREGVVSRS